MSSGQSHVQHLPGQRSTAGEEDDAKGKKKKRERQECGRTGGRVSRKDLLSLSGHPGGGSSSAFSLHLAESIKYISAKRYTATVEHIKQNASMSSLLLFSSLMSQAFQHFTLSWTSSPSFICPRSCSLTHLALSSSPSSLKHSLPFSLLSLSHGGVESPPPLPFHTGGFYSLADQINWAYTSDDWAVSSRLRTLGLLTDWLTDRPLEREPLGALCLRAGGLQHGLHWRLWWQVDSGVPTEGGF